MILKWALQNSMGVNWINAHAAPVFYFAGNRKTAIGSSTGKPCVSRVMTFRAVLVSGLFTSRSGLWLCMSCKHDGENIAGHWRNSES